MDIAITLPQYLWQAICDGDKEYECRKRIPYNFFRPTDRCFVIEKGTSNVVGWFTINQFLSCIPVDEIKKDYLGKLCISEEWYDEYAKHEDVLQLWEIGKVVYQFSKPQDREMFLGLLNNPQSYVYCHTVYNEEQRIFKKGKAFKV